MVVVILATSSIRFLTSWSWWTQNTGSLLDQMHIFSLLRVVGLSVHKQQLPHLFLCNPTASLSIHTYTRHLSLMLCVWERGWEREREHSLFRSGRAPKCTSVDWARDWWGRLSSSLREDGRLICWICSPSPEIFLFCHRKIALVDVKMLAHTRNMSQRIL